MTTDSRSSDEAQIEKLSSELAEIRSELAKAIVGHEETIEQVLTALIAGGHCLLVGVPGLAKTLLVRSLASTLHLSFNRIQFTPDLMPTDITGTEVIQEDKESGQRGFKFLKGPIFGNIILADEINRTPPKTQSALLEAMQERQVTAGGERHQLPDPFFVLATQNPIEQEGTYPLPEAQLDRFMFDIRLNYPSADDELQVIMQTTDDHEETLNVAVDGQQLAEYCRLVRRIPIAEPVARYAMNLARFSRPQNEQSPEVVREYVRWGSGPRGSQFLVLGGKAHAAFHGRCLVEREDINAIARPALRHRIRLNFSADSAGVDSDSVIDQLISEAEKIHMQGDDAAALAKVLK